MANELSGNEPTQFGGPAVRPEPNAWDVIKKILQPIASLKLTVALFSMGLFVIFVGTLAQDKMEIWRAVDLYFHAWQIQIPFNVFFPSEWFPDLQDTKGAIWFPGGMLIGVMMMINLTAAHTVRFKVQASGGRLASGLSVIGLGAIVTLVVILSGHNADGLQGEPPFEWSTFWKICKIGVVALFLASLFGTAHVFVKLKRDRVLERLAMLFTNGVLLALVIFLWNIGHTDAALRIVWQMAQGTIAALVLLGGCILVFKRRAGIAVLHTGVMLLMVNELIVANHAVEERMSFSEGETVNYASDIRAVELAVTDRSGSKEKVIVVPFAHHGTLTMHVEDNRVLRHSLLPFDVQVMKYLENSTDLRALVDGESTLATRGIGRYQTVDNIVSVAGADIGGSVNHSSAFLKLTNKTGADLGTYLLSQWAGEAPELITVDGKTYEVVLRFKRQYKPYSITLLDTGRREYVGTSTPRDFYSDVDLIDPSRNFELKGKKIWMNNPLRYAGETFYQSGHNVFNGVEYSTLQIVKNRGWMTPYVACGIVAIGMFAHFWIVLVRFLKRVSTNPTVKWGVIGTSMNALTSLFEMTLGAKDPPKEEPASETPKRPQKPSPRPALQRRVQTPQPSLARPAPTNKFVNIGLPIAAVVVCCAWLFSRVPTPEPKAGEFNLYEFGKLPVAYEGRVKPIDTLA
ncbi:MAG: cytochrome c biogenesis protein ResB, partial [Planctomycetes bacterium]|nr:cytochrome c biogenesis protein ResB [Planctomycetota bacterium]